MGYPEVIQPTCLRRVIGQVSKAEPDFLRCSRDRAIGDWRNLSAEHRCVNRVAGASLRIGLSRESQKDFAIHLQRW